MLDIPVAGTPVRQPLFMLTVGLKHKKWGHPTDSAPDDQQGKRACSGTEEANKVRSSKTVPASSRSSDQDASEPLRPPSSPAKNDAIPNDRVALEALGGTGGQDRDSTGGISKNNTDQSGIESESD